MCVYLSRTVELPQGLLVRDGGAAAERSLGRVQHLSRLPHVSPGLSVWERRLADVLNANRVKTSRKRV